MSFKCWQPCLNRATDWTNNMCENFFCRRNECTFDNFEKFAKNWACRIFAHNLSEIKPWNLFLLKFQKILEITGIMKNPWFPSTTFFKTVKKFVISGINRCSWYLCQNCFLLHFLAQREGIEHPSWYASVKVAHVEKGWKNFFVLLLSA